MKLDYETLIDIVEQNLIMEEIEDEKDFYLIRHLNNIVFEEGIKTLVSSAIDLGKSVIGIFTGKFENVSQVQAVVKNGGILDSTSSLINNAIDEAKKCKETGEEKTIVVNFSGHGLMDFKGYASYMDGSMENSK